MPTLKWIAEHVHSVKIGPNEPVCANCAHYYQHYVACETGYTPTSCGHCVATQRMKDRNAGDTCPMYEPKNAQ